MWLKINSKSRNTRVLQLKTLSITTLVLIALILLSMASCSPKTTVEKMVNQPPTLFDSQNNTALPQDQQWLVPLEQLQGAHPKSENQAQANSTTLEQMTAAPHWLSPTTKFQSQSGRLYIYVDFAGQQETRKDLAINILPVCHLQGKSIPCAKTNRNDPDAIFHISTDKNTDYHTLVHNKSWLFYGQNFQDIYSLPYGNQALLFIVNAQIPKGLKLDWLRISVSENPITLKQTSVMLGSQHHAWFKYVLLLIPVLAFVLFQQQQGFESTRALVLGGLCLLLFGIHTLVWDINYMVLGCLLLSFASVLYCFGISLYRLLYLTGLFIIAGYAKQKYGDFNKDFFMQTGLIFLIGCILYFCESKNK